MCPSPQSAITSLPTNPGRAADSGISLIRWWVYARQNKLQGYSRQRHLLTQISLYCIMRDHLEGRLESKGIKSFWNIFLLSSEQMEHLCGHLILILLSWVDWQPLQRRKMLPGSNQGKLLLIGVREDPSTGLFCDQNIQSTLLWSQRKATCKVPRSFFVIEKCDF